MDTLNELIAEGEMVIERSKKKNLDNISVSGTTKSNNLAVSQKDSGGEPVNEIDLQKLFNDGILLSNSKVSTPRTSTVRSLLVNGTDSSRIRSKSKSSASSTKKCGKPKNISMSDDHRSTSNSSFEESTEETFSQEHVKKLKEECALIFSLGYSMASSLLNANRVLHQLVSNDSHDNSSETGKSILSEISSCNGSCKENEEELQSSSQRIQTLLAKVSESYFKSKEQEECVNQIQNMSLELVGFTKELLIRHSLQHLVHDVDEKRTPLRILEEVKLGLTLLLGELPSQVLHQQTIELQESQNHHRKLEQKFEALEKEFKRCKEEKVKKIVQLEIEIERKAKELEEANEEIKFLQKEMESMEVKFKEEIKSTETKRISLVEELVQVKQIQDELRSIVNKEREKYDMLRSKLEGDLSALKSKLRSFEEEYAKLEEAKAEMPCTDCKTQSKSHASEIDQYKAKLIKAQLGQQVNLDKIKELEADIEKQVVLNDSLKADISCLLESAKKKAEEFSVDLFYWQKKCDVKGEELCERESEIRQNEVVILELQADLGLERQRNASLSSEIDLLQKQVEGLDFRMKKIIGFCPRDVRIECGLAQAKSLGEMELEEKISKYLEESHHREMQLKRLLQEKDEEFIKLRTSLSEQIAQKNEDLENLTLSIEKLEEEMGHISSSLNVSSEFFSTSCKTSSYLDARAKHIEALQEQVNRSLLSMNCPSCKSNTEAIEELKEDLSEAKKLVRSAREEARKERLEAAKLKQQLTILQIDLESARELAKCSTDKITIKITTPDNSVQSLQNFSLREQNETGE